jgi:hypothetical protein
MLPNDEPKPASRRREAQKQVKEPRSDFVAEVRHEVQRQGISARGEARTQGSASATSGKGRTFTFWLGADRRQRLERLEEKGAPVDISKTCQSAVDEALEAAERVLIGDRMARIIARLKTTRTPAEQVQAEGEAAGRAWAEDVAALSDLRRAERILAELIRERKEASNVDIVGERIYIQWVTWPEGQGDPEPVGQTMLPQSVPIEVFRGGFRAYTAWGVEGFLRGAVDVLKLVDGALIAQRRGATTATEV